MSLLDMSQLLGNLGEFVGALAVVATLFYLAVQVRLGREATEANSRSLEETRKLALAQAYQARADMVTSQLNWLRDSPHIEQLDSTIDPATVVKPEARRRLQVHFRTFMNVADNIHYQYERGFLDEDYYQRQFHTMVRIAAPKWRALGVEEPRDSFEREVDRILEEDVA